MTRRWSRRAFLGALALGGVYLALRGRNLPNGRSLTPSETPTPTATPPPTATPSRGPSPIPEGGMYSIDNWPGVDWHLFADTSVWNTPLDTSRVDPNSE